MKTKSIIEALLIVFILAACAPATIPAKTATPLHTSTPVPPIPTATLWTTPEITTPTAYPSVYGLLFSPDGMLRIQSPDWKYWEIINKDGTILWSFSYDSNKYLKFGTDKVPFFSEAGYVPFYWSKDGKFVYLTCLHGGENSSTKFFGNAFVDGSGMFRFDVTTGEMIEIVSEIFPGYYAFSFSPDGKELVYANQTETPVRVKLLNLSTLQEKIILVGSDNILEIEALGWSPNQDKLIYSTLETNYDIFIIDLESLEKQNIIRDFENHLSFENWDENGKVYYHDTYRAVWQLNLENKMLTPLAMPTLTLSP
jgi:WD40 repeat protein